VIDVIFWECDEKRDHRDEFKCRMNVEKL